MHFLFESVLPLAKLIECKQSEDIAYHFVQLHGVSVAFDEIFITGVSYLFYVLVA